MNMIQIYLLQMALTGGISLALVAYLRPALQRILVDLCGTQERAHFWVALSSVYLVGLPLIFGLGYNPLNSETAMLFFDAARQMRLNLLGFLLALIGIGVVVSFFALVAPRPTAPTKG